jgi:hypothetical protein
MARGHGETRRDYEERRAFEYQKRLAPPAIGKPVEVQVACRCPYRPYAHCLVGAEAERHRSAEWRAYEPINPADGARSRR